MINFLAKNLAYLREREGLNQTEMATALDLKRSTYANYENGETEPKIEFIHLVVLKFNTNAHDLLFSDLKEGKVNESLRVIEKPQKGKVNSKLLGKVNEQNTDNTHGNSSIENAYKQLLEEVKIKDETIRQKNETIAALQGQVDALKLATSVMEARLVGKDKSQRKTG